MIDKLAGKLIQLFILILYVLAAPFIWLQDRQEGENE